jgi:hypothetical protein
MEGAMHIIKRVISLLLVCILFLSAGCSSRIPYPNHRLRNLDYRAGLYSGGSLRKRIRHVGFTAALVSDFPEGEKRFDTRMPGRHTVVINSKSIPH